MDSHIGLLIPRSGFYPTLGFDLQAGLQTGLNPITENVTITMETIGFGEKEGSIYGQCENMLLQGKKIVIAYINAFVAVKLQPLFKAANAILIVLDSGYHFPAHKGRLENVIFLSLQGALCCRMAAESAAHRSLPVAFAASYYDAGYRAPYVISRAVEEAGTAISFYHITPLKKVEFNLNALQEWIQSIDESVLLATFCGDMSADFLLHLSRFEKKPTALYAGPYVAEETWLSKSVHPGTVFKAYVSWDRSLPHPANQHFISAIKSRKPTLFSLLGYEAGLLITRLHSSSLEGHEAIMSLTEQPFDTPRGTLWVDVNTFQTRSPVYEIEIKPSLEGSHCTIDSIQACTSTEEQWNALQSDIASLQGASTTSWLNAYPCIA